MKRILFLTTLLCLTLASVDAQTIRKETFKRDIIEPWDLLGGPKVGVSASNLSGLGGDFVIGPVVGGFIETLVNDNFHISGELYWSHQGAANGKYKPLNSGTARGCDITLDYINVAFLARWYPVKNLPLNVYSGLTVSRMFNAKLKKAGESDPDINDTPDIKDELRSQDVSIPIGATYEMGKWLVDVRYNYGLANLPDTKEAKTALGNVRNSMLSVTVGYRFLFW